MNLVQVKQEDIKKCCPLDGVKVVEIRTSAYAVTSMTLQDAAGHVMVVEGAEYSGSVRVLTKAPPRKCKQYRLTGLVCTGSIGLEVKIDETFDDRQEAVKRKDALGGSGGMDLKLTETEIEVPDAE